METGSETTKHEKERRPIAVAIHGTSSVRAQRLIEEGFDPEKSTDYAGRTRAFYYRFNPGTLPPEAFVESSWEKASMAVDGDREQGVESKPVLVVFEPLPILTAFGKTIQKNPILTKSSEGSFEKKYKPRILGILPLPHRGEDQFSEHEQRAIVVSDLQHKILSYG